VALYVLLSTPLGFLLVAPVCLAMLFRTFGQRWGASLLWAIGGTLVVHVAFYKLLRVPLPWGVLRPFY
jgi:putative tricarboxylic transport membrane protein